MIILLFKVVGKTWQSVFLQLSGQRALANRKVRDPESKKPGLERIQARLFLVLFLSF
jgi:hypothetical protein